MGTLNEQPCKRDCPKRTPFCKPTCPDWAAYEEVKARRYAARKQYIADGGVWTAAGKSARQRAKKARQAKERGR